MFLLFLAIITLYLLRKANKYLKLKAHTHTEFLKFEVPFLLKVVIKNLLGSG